MFGRATFTIVMSSNSMNTPTQTAVRVHHLRSIVFGPSQALGGVRGLTLVLDLPSMVENVPRDAPEGVAGRPLPAGRLGRRAQPVREGQPLLRPSGRLRDAHLYLRRVGTLGFLDMRGDRVP